MPQRAESKSGREATKSEKSRNRGADRLDKRLLSGVHRPERFRPAHPERGKSGQADELLDVCAEPRDSALARQHTEVFGGRERLHGDPLAPLQVNAAAHREAPVAGRERQAAAAGRAHGRQAQ